MEYNTSPRRSDLMRKSQDMSTTIAELSKATLELKKIESKIQNIPSTETLVIDQVDNNDNDNNRSYHHQWILDRSTIMTVDPLEISSSSSPPPPPPSTVLSPEILNTDI